MQLQQREVLRCGGRLALPRRLHFWTCRARTIIREHSLLVIHSTFIHLMDLREQCKTTLGEQLDRVYQKLHRSYRLRIERKDFENFPKLQRLGRREELRRAQEKAYKPPPLISDSAFPASAYIPPKKQRHVRLASVVQTSLDEVEVTLSSSSNLASETQTYVYRDG